MDKHEYEVAKHIAEHALKFKIDYNCHGHVRLEMCGQQWDFDKETDAQVIEKIVTIWDQVSSCMKKLVDERLLHWAAVNKKNFN